MLKVLEKRIIDKIKRRKRLKMMKRLGIVQSLPREKFNIFNQKPPAVNQSINITITDHSTDVYKSREELPYKSQMADSQIFTIPEFTNKSMAKESTERYGSSSDKTLPNILYSKILIYSSSLNRSTESPKITESMDFLKVPKLTKNRNDKNIRRNFEISENSKKHSYGRYSTMKKEVLLAILMVL